MASRQECLLQLKNNFPEIQQKQLEGILDDLDSIKKDSKSASEYRSRANQYFREAQKKSRRVLFQKKNDAVKLQREIDRLSTGDFDGRPGDALKSVLTGTEFLTKGGSRSVALEAKVISDRAKRVLSDELEKNELLDLAKSGKMDRDVLKAKYAMANGESLDGISKEGVQIAEAYTKTYNLLQDEMELAGSTRGRINGYMQRNHDAISIERAGFEQWKQDMHRLLDPQKTWGARADDGDFINEELERIFNSIKDESYNSGLINTKGSNYLEVLSSGGLDARASRSRRFQFRDADSEFEYMQKYSGGSTMASLVSSIQRDARAAASINRLGSNPTRAFEALKSHVSKNLRPKETPKGATDFAKKALKGGEEVKPFEATVKEADELFKNVTKGFDVGSSAVANFSSNARAFTSMATLGRGVITSAPTDLATGASVLRAKTGQGYFSAMAQKLKASGDLVKDPKLRQEMASRLELYNDNALGELWSRMGDEDQINRSMARSLETFFKLNGMKEQTSIYKTGDQMLLSMNLADNAFRGFGEMNDITRANLERYGINSEDWEVLRTASEEVKGRKVITPFAVNELDIPAPQKRELSLKLSSYLRENAEFLATPTPDERTKSFMLGGSDPDNMFGQLVRFIGQFKSFPITMGRTMRHAMLSDPKNAKRTMREALQTKSGAKVAAQTMMGATLMGGLSEMARNAIDNETTDVTSADFWGRSMTRGGSMGLYGDFLMADYDKHYRSFSSEVLGPTLGGTFEGGAEVLAGMRNGDPDASKAFNVILRNTPYQNLFYTRSALDYLFLDEVQESLSPGFKARQQRRLIEEGRDNLIEF